jgi:hypothetical protein
LYIEGYFPEYQIDHINGIRDANRWCNLRHVTQSCNSKNVLNLRKSNTSGVTGVNRSKNNKWLVRISYNGRRIFKGE